MCLIYIEWHNIGLAAIVQQQLQLYLCPCWWGYSFPSKESTFSEILILAIKSTFSHSNQHKNSYGEVSKFVFHIHNHRETIEVQKLFLGKFQQNWQYLRICMELRFQIWATHTLTCDLSKENRLLTPRFAEMLTIKYRPLQNCFNSSALLGQWT